MNSVPLLVVGVGFFLCALMIIAFVFYDIGKNKTTKVKIDKIASLLLFTTITVVADPAANYIQTLGAIIFGYLSAATVSYFLGFTGRPQQKTN